MNKIKNLLVLIFLGLLCFSCDNSNKQKNPKAGYGTVTFNANCSRTVQEDFKDDAFDNISLYAKETDSLLNWTDLEPMIEWDNYSSFNNAEVPMKVGSYDFYLEASMGDVKFESNVLTNVTISEINSNDLFFELKLVNSGDGTGRVIIKYNFAEKNVNTAKFELNKITYENTDPENPSAEKERITTPVTVNSDDYVINNSTDGDVSYYCDFKKTLPAGNYELIARFETSTGGENGVGEVVEYPTSINVSENIDSVGEFDLSEYFNPFYRIMYAKDLGEISAPTRYSMYDEIIKTDFPSLESTKGTTNYPFVSWCTDSALTKEFNGITKYGEYRGNLSLYPKWKLKESQYLLFDHESVQDLVSLIWKDYYKFSMFEENLDIAEISDENPLIPEAEFPVIGGPDFFYYFSEEGLEKSNDSGVDINLNVDGEHYISSISYDNETDTLYGRCDEYTNNGGLSPTYVYEKSLLCKYNEDENIFTPIYETKLVHGENSFMGMSNNFAVHNGKMYFCLKDTDNVIIYIYDGIIGDDGNDDEQITIDVSDLAGATSTNTNTILDYLSINDMMFVDGKLYILWSCNYEYYTYNGGIKTYFDDDPARLYRFGGVLCVNENGIVETLFTSTAFPSVAKPISTSKNEFTDPAVVNYYGPSSETDKNYLFGPTKFIAIKPKKLVFADEGIFVYNDETDSNNPKYKNINRVVEIDLANNQITEVPINTEVSFTKDETNEISVYSDYVSINKAN